MNILLVHNYYKCRGGEDAVVDAEQHLLESRKHRIIPYFIESSSIDKKSTITKLFIPLQIPFKISTYLKIQRIIKSESVDIVHIHNYWPLISPSVLFACNKLTVPWVQTIHNYRYIVPDALLNPSDLDSVTRTLHIKRRSTRCFQNSFILTQLYRFTSWFVQKSGCVDNGCGVLQVLNQFGYDVHAQRFSTEHLRIRGNFLPQSEVFKCTPLEEKELCFIYLGRLSDEKGVEILCNAWKKARIAGKLKICGTGPLEDKLKNEYGKELNIEFLGFVSGKQKFELLARSAALIVPSVCIESFGLVVAESFFCGTPVIASGVGGLPEMINEGITGFLFDPGNVNELVCIFKDCENNKNKLIEMGKNARKYAEENFSEEKSYERLMEIYNEVKIKNENKRTNRKRKKQG